MENRRVVVGGIQLKIHRGSLLLKLAVLAVIVLSTVALLTLRVVQTNIEQHTQEMREEASQLLEENAELKEKTENADSVEGMMDIAESELGYVDPNTTFYEPQASEDN